MYWWNTHRGRTYWLWLDAFLSNLFCVNISACFSLPGACKTATNFWSNSSRIVTRLNNRAEIIWMFDHFCSVSQNLIKDPIWGTSCPIGMSFPIPTT